MKLETKRLIIRDWMESDLDDFYEYASVEGVGEMAGWRYHESMEISKAILDEFIKNGDEYAIILKEENKAIGSLGLQRKTRDNKIQGKEQREIGYVLSKFYWGKGIMPEAVSAVIKYAFECLNMDILWCCHFKENEQSKRVIEKSGFKFYCDGIYESTSLNKAFDDKIYIMTKEDYIRSNNVKSI